MPSTPAAAGRQYWSSGRGFASADPERRGEVIGYIRSGGIDTSATTRTPLAAARPRRGEWSRVQPDPEVSFEGSSSRRWR